MRQIFARQPLEWISPEREGPTLRRTLGWPALTAIGLGTMLGGIFPTIGAGAHAAGPAVILAYVLSGLVSLCVALCYAEFASMVPVAGSAYTYAYATLGEVVAWVIGWDLILEYGLSVAPTASSWSAYAQQLLGTAGITLPAWMQTGAIASGQIDVVAALIVVVITVLVAIGIRESANVNGVLVVFQIVTMIVFIAATIGATHRIFLHPFAPLGFHGVVASTALVFYAYIGFDTVTVASEEANDPVRHVPVGIILALAIGAALYVALTFCTVAVMPYQKLSEGAAMLDAVKSATRNPLVFWIVALGGVAGNTTVMVTSLLGQIRIFYVMARDRMLPPGVAKIHPRFRTPARMTLITGGIVAILAALLPLSDLLDFVNIGTLSAFAIVCAGVLVLRIVQPQAHRPFRAPLVWIFTIAGAASCLFLITGLSLPTWIRFAVWFVIGIAIYAVYGYRKSRLRVGS
ncbi:MAG TPA: amino acid permease [Candidatus Acidoferrales bacterium]|nr:amino acid permease [Candidatus Acidoferrales bacterium]